MISKDLQCEPVDRRQFATMLAAVGLTAPTLLAQTRIEAPLVLQLSRNAWVPNDRLPVLFYRAALNLSGADLASSFEQAFLRNGWPPQWRNGIYDFHHYHSTAHEVLGIAAGQGALCLVAPVALK